MNPKNDQPYKADKATTLGVQKYWDEHDKRQKLKKQKQKDLEDRMTEEERKDRKDSDKFQ